MNTRAALRDHLASGDLSAFLGLTFDNVAQLIVFAGLLIGLFHYPADLVLGRMLPGTALGVLVGDLIYTYMAVRLARRTGRTDVTAMPLGIDTPSLFGLTFGVLGPVFVLTRDATLSWQVGMAVMVCMGVFKVALSFVAPHLQRVLPAPAMLGTIGAVGILLISFLPLLKLVAAPVVGIPALFLMLLSLFRGLRVGRHAPLSLLVVAGATLLFYGLHALGWVTHEAAAPAAGLGLTLPVPTLGFVKGLALATRYLAIALPLAFVTVIGGIDTTVSAAAAGDTYDTRDILLTEGVATLVAGLFGGVLQTTPYIGHPAYKRMGARAGYTLATALFVGVGGAVGVLAWVVQVLPEVVVVPILVFIGLEITAQAFCLVPARHAPAVAACFLPVMADLVLILGGGWLGAAGVDPGALRPDAAAGFRGIQLLAGGFVFSSLLYGTAVTFLLDGRSRAAALALLVCAAAALVGLIHSPLPDGSVYLPWPHLLASKISYGLAGGYALCAAVLFALPPRYARGDQAAAP